MTQNTQTVSTWQRVERLMDAMLTVEHSEPYPHEDGTMGGEYSDYVYDEDHKFRNLIAAEIDALTAERDEAYAVLQKRTAERDGYLADVIFNQEWIADMQRRTDLVIAQVAKERDEARAEVERLRLPAEAWIAYDDYMMCPEEHEAEKFQVWVAAHNAAKSAQVARAAKEAKP